MAKSKQVARASSKEVAAVDANLQAQLLADSGAGFEEAGRDAFAIPFLTILQDLSPQVKSKMSGYVPGAKPGMIYNSVTQEVFDEVRVIPCYYSQTFIEWIPRGKGNNKGGFVGAHPTNTPLVRQAVRDGAKSILPNGHELQDTRQHFVLLVREDGTTDGCLIPMKSTQIKVSRRWMSQMKAALIEVNGRLIEPPSFAWSYKLRTQEDANEEGAWYSWVIDDRQRVTDVDLYNRAKAFKQAMTSGQAKVNYDEMHAADQSAQRGPGAGFGDLDDNEIDA